MKPTLLFITQKIHQSDDDLAFVILWVKQFIKEGYNVKVICLEKREYDGSFPVYSLGKEEGLGKIARTLRFLKYIFTLKYDRVFVHMNPEYFTLGGWWWFITRKPMYFWYTHYTMTIHAQLAGFFSKRMFAATPQSLPQFEGNPKKVILGHGIDINFWLRDTKPAERTAENNMLTVHRLSRSKRFEIGIRALLSLPKDYSLTVYGRDVEKDYYKEITSLIERLQLQDRISLAGPVPMAQLKEVYPRYRIMVNMASETIDKTMLEGMLFGIYPVTTKGNSIAIGLPIYPENDKPETIANFISGGEWRKYDAAFLSDIVRKKHSLEALIKKMDAYIAPGN